MDDERTAKLRADFENVYAPDAKYKTCIWRNASGVYNLMQTQTAWTWWKECANFYRVRE